MTMMQIIDGGLAAWTAEAWQAALKTIYEVTKQSHWAQ